MACLFASESAAAATGRWRLHTSSRILYTPQLRNQFLRRDYPGQTGWGGGYGLHGKTI